MMSLEEEFEKELWRTVDVAKENGYTPTYFMRMLESYGGVRTAKRLLAKVEIQDGLKTLAKKNLLEISVEAIVLQEKFQVLFKGDVIDYLVEARRRLEELGYFTKGN